LENAELLARNGQLRAELTSIGQALGQLSGNRGGRGRRAAETPILSAPKPKRQRRPVTDPEVLERRRQALVKARAVRAERLAAARQE